MKFSLLFILLFLLSCQKNADAPSNPSKQPEKVSMLEDEIGSFVFVSSIKGIEIKGERIAREGNLTTGEDLKIIETSSKKIVDEFQMNDWGKVAFKLDQNVLHVYPLKDAFEIEYSIADEKVVRKPTCSFKSIPDSTKFDILIAQTKEPNPDWESILTGLSDLARQGDRKSYEFFVKPDAAAKTIFKNSEDGAASILKVLKFMKENGCLW